MVSTLTFFSFRNDVERLVPFAVERDLARRAPLTGAFTRLQSLWQVLARAWASDRNHAFRMEVERHAEFAFGALVIEDGDGVGDQA